MFDDIWSQVTVSVVEGPGHFNLPAVTNSGLKVEGEVSFGPCKYAPAVYVASLKDQANI